MPPHVPPEPLPCPPEALFCSPEPQLTVITPQECMAVALGAQVGHVVTYLCSPEGSLIYTVFTKKCQKRAKRGYPLFLPVFGEACGHFGPPPPPLVWALGGQICTMGAIPMVHIPHFEPKFRGGGSWVPASFQKSCILEGGHT